MVRKRGRAEMIESMCERGIKVKWTVFLMISSTLIYLASESVLVEYQTDLLYVGFFL